MVYRFLRYPGGVGKALTFSYDDGCADDIRLADIMTKYGVKGTFNFHNEELKDILKNSRMTKEEVYEHILNPGHEVAAHGAFHRASAQQIALDGIHDVLFNRLELEERYDRIIRGMAYPDTGIRRFANGATYENIKRYLTDLGIAYARTLGSDNDDFMLPTDWHAWMPTAHHNNPKLMEYADKFLKEDVCSMETYPSRRTPLLFFVWGHSFEFRLKDNWNVIEEFCEKMGGRDDIWYATNIEIYDYVTAYNRLECSADGKRFHNPTATKIWFDVDGEVYEINPGETIKR